MAKRQEEKLAAATVTLAEPTLLDKVLGQQVKPEQAPRAPTYTLVLENQLGQLAMIDKNRCGNSSGDYFHYSLRIVANVLDSRGFVLDGAAVADQIAHSGRSGYWVASCEQIAGGLILLVANLSERVRFVAAKVLNDRGHVEIEWTRGESLPEGPRIATDHEIYEHFVMQKFSPLGCGR